jgi:hypothetical protein
MGDAKRRKQFDPTFGKSEKRFSITVSELTGNFLVMVDQYCYDSALKLSDAEKVVTDLIEYVKDFPLPAPQGKLTHAAFMEWMKKTIGIIDIPDAIALAYTPSSTLVVTTFFESIQNGRSF